MDNINQSLGDRRSAREHEARVQDMAKRTLGMIQPMLQLQVSLLRQLADICEAVARNAETAVANIADQARPAQQHDQQQDRDQA